MRQLGIFSVELLKNNFFCYTSVSDHTILLDFLKDSYVCHNLTYYYYHEYTRSSLNTGYFRQSSVQTVLIAYERRVPS